MAVGPEQVLWSVPPTVLYICLPVLFWVKVAWVVDMSHPYTENDPSCRCCWGILWDNFRYRQDQVKVFHSFSISRPSTKQHWTFFLFLISLQCFTVIWTWWETTWNNMKHNRRIYNWYNQKRYIYSIYSTISDWIFGWACSLFLFRWGYPTPGRSRALAGLWMLRRSSKPGKLPGWGQWLWDFSMFAWKFFAHCAVSETIMKHSTMLCPKFPQVQKDHVTQIEMQQERLRATVLSGEGLQFLFLRKAVASMSVEQRELLALLWSFLGGNHLSAAKAGSLVSKGRGYSMVPRGLLVPVWYQPHVRFLESFMTKWAKEPMRFNEPTCFQKYPTTSMRTFMMWHVRHELGEAVAFYCQHPPTLRLQPGPSRWGVNEPWINCETFSSPQPTALRCLCRIFGESMFWS